MQANTHTTTATAALPTGYGGFVPLVGLRVIAGRGQVPVENLIGTEGHGFMMMAAVRCFGGPQRA